MEETAKSSPPEELGEALRAIAKSPFKTLVPPWSWKAAVFTGILRALAFFLMNLRSGEWAATKALVVEGVFAVFAGGLIGAVSQFLRKAKPLWATALLVWAGLPAVMLLAQAAVHLVARTPHLSAGVVASFFLSAGTAAFTWFAMRQGALLGGVDETTVGHDVKALPGITWKLVLCVAPSALEFNAASSPRAAP